jgi:serine protease AprX
MRHRRTLAASCAAAISLGLLALGMAPTSQATAVNPTASVTHAIVPSQTGRYIARISAGTSHEELTHAVRALGGSVVAFQESLGTVVVTVPSSALASLGKVAGVVDVAPDGQVEAQSLGFTASSQPGSMTNVTQITGATEWWKKGYTGKGVDVAIIDTGVAPVPGLSDSGKIVIGADLSFESQTDATRYMDSYGHGTNMTGIMAGRETAQASGATYAADTTNFYGMAPDARVLSVKLADHGGAVDVSQMIAAIDWVVKNRWSEGMNVRVLNISYGTLSKQDAQADPLSWAAEVAWKAGITVVASAGNDGDTTVGLASPAFNPWVIAVGAQDTKGTSVYTDDSVPSFSERAVSGGRAPDVVAPGVGIVSLGVPGAYLFDTYASARIGNNFLRGNGTSQSAAVVSGAAALVYQRYSYMNPDDVKNYLRVTATPLSGVATAAQGAGALNLRNALNLAPAAAQQSLPNGNGNGSLENARGGQYVTLDGAPLTGEVDIMGTAWSSSTMATKATSRNAWDWDGTFNGAIWTGGSLTPDTVSWAGKTWQGKTWQGKTWQGKTWQGKTWQTGVWTGRTWSSASWGSPVPTPGWAGRVWSSAGWN